MDNETTGSVDNVIRTTLQAAKAQLSAASAGAQVALAELRLLASQAGLLLCLILIAGGLVLISWLIILVAVALFLIGNGLSAVGAAAIVGCMNVLVLISIGFWIGNVLKTLSLPHTRRVLGIKVSDPDALEE